MKEIGDYLLERTLGRGSTAQVYLARRKSDGASFALKVFHPGLWDQPELRRRATAEVKTVHALKHPKIVQIHDSLLENDPPAIVLEYVEGVSLEEFQPRLPYILPEISVRLVLEVLDALSFAHSKDIVHRDLKPANILIGRDGRVCVGDFGLAKMTDISRLTLSGTILGSPDYMSPEQARGEFVEPCSDVFSAGSVLYFLITGSRPFSRSSPLATLAAVSDAKFEPVQRRNPKVSPRLARILNRAMTRDKSSRYRSAEEFSAALREYLATLGLEGEDFGFGAWMRTPTNSCYDALQMISKKLSQTARKQIDAAEWDAATETLAHLSLVAPESIEIVTLMEQISNERLRLSRRRWRIPALAAAAILVAIGAWALIQNSRTLAPTAPTLAPKTPVATTDEIAQSVPPQSKPKLKVDKPLKAASTQQSSRLARVEFDVPGDIQAYWDDKPMGSRDVLTAEKEGIHQVRLEKVGAKPIIQRITVSALEPTVIRVR